MSPTPLAKQLENGIELNIDMGHKIKIALDQNLNVKSKKVY